MKITTAKKAAFSSLWITTTEEERIIRAHRRELKKDIQIFSYDIAAGFKQLTPNGEENVFVWKVITPDDIPQPGAALEMILTMPENSVFYMKDFHKWFEDPTVVRRAMNIKEECKATGRLVAYISAAGPSAIPLELKNDVTPFRFDLPTKGELSETVKRSATDAGKEAPQGEELDKLAESLIGLTEEAAENALSLCLVEKKRFDYQTLLDQKARLIEGTAGLTFMQYTTTFDDLAGLENVKDYLKNVAGHPMARGIILYGIPGTGKSELAKALGNYLKRPTLAANLSATGSKFQGEGETKLETMLSGIEAFGPSVVYCDEMEKSIKGAEGGADSDAGAGARKVGRLLIYFNDRPDGGAFWLATCNSLTDLLTISGGAFVRRFDAIFFLDMPQAEQRKAICKIWSKKMNVDIPDTFNTEGMTGADIAKLARLMRMMNTDAETARRYIIPTAEALGSRIEEIRKAARSVCIPADRPETKTPTATGRKLDI